MVLVPCYRCNRYHRIVPLGNMLSHHKGIVLKSSRPSLPLKKAPPLTPTLSPQERGRKPPYSVLEPLRYKVGGPSKVSPGYAGWDRQGRKSNMREFYCCFANDDQVIFISILIPPSRHSKFLNEESFSETKTPYRRNRQRPSLLFRLNYR